ncbi:MAG: hypothetical protein JST94_10550 [Bacteroidetes bacterium]|nr:hypothetical protein [Bacteroidota bacterium]MBS1642904.1 hypothetical protein [Bacteroidota bacterium]MBS1671868.1 hypothetical protein [Bacteroidota bacterium]
MNGKLKKIGIRIIVFVVAVQLLNIGLFAQNIPITLTANHQPLNVINSVTEYIAEVVLGKKDAIPETGSNGDHDKGEVTFVLKFLTFNLLYNSNCSELTVSDLLKNTLYNNYRQHNFTNWYAEIIPHPPKATC